MDFCLRRALSLAALALAACESSPAVDPLDDAPPVLETYARILHAGYDDSVLGARELDGALAAFVAAPDATTFQAARQAWLDSRPAYLETEVARFYGGPIDDPETGPEGRINSWPMDEAYVDYVIGPGPAFERVYGGVVNDPSILADISAQGLAELNQIDSEESVTTGYHAIEFLLWGQDRRDDGPGERPHTDFVAMGTATDHERRAAYLTAVGALLVSDLETVRDAWAPGAPYRTSFVALPPREGLTLILRGMGSLSGSELSGERMNVAYMTKDQEDEHSCFSDNTHVDALHDALGIQNVYLGRYTRTDGSVVEGPSLSDLVRARDPELDARMRMQLSASVDAIGAIPTPFDQAIQGLDSAPGRVAVRAAIDALRAQTATIVEIADLFDVQLNLEE